MIPSAAFDERPDPDQVPRRTCAHARDPDVRSRPEQLSSKRRANDLGGYRKRAGQRPSFAAPRSVLRHLVSSTTTSDAWELLNLCFVRLRKHSSRWGCSRLLLEVSSPSAAPPSRRAGDPRLGSQVVDGPEKHRQSDRRRLGARRLVARGVTFPGNKGPVSSHSVTIAATVRMSSSRPDAAMGHDCEVSAAGAAEPIR